MERMCAFLARKHPDEDWMKETMAAGNEMNISNTIGGSYKDAGVEEPMENVQTAEIDPKEAQFANDHTSQDHGNRTEKGNGPKRASNVVIQHKVNESAEYNEVVQISSKNSKCVRAPKDKEHIQHLSSSHEKKSVKASRTQELELPKHNKTQKKPKTVIMVSLAPRTKGLVVGKGTIQSRDSNYVVGGDSLGDAFWAINVVDVSIIGSERLPPPFGDTQTIEDAIGHCIAWPSTHVKRAKDVSN